jgi:oligopeptidase A
VLAFARGYLQRASPAPLPEGANTVASFTHLFAGPVAYASGYYSYKWAEVLSADCFAAFEEAPQGVFDEGVGQRFLDEILSVGGSRPAIESFRSFRGRAPSIDALLRHSGMIDQSLEHA